MSSNGIVPRLAAQREDYLLHAMKQRGGAAHSPGTGLAFGRAQSHTCGHFRA